MKFKIWWIDKQRFPQNQPNPEFPRGVDVDLSEGATKTCKTKLPYPAPRCGVFAVECCECKQRVVITTAGRKDDPRSVKLACKSRTQ